MKRITSFLLILAMLAVVSCGGNTKDPVQTTDGSTATTAGTTVGDDVPPEVDIPLLLEGYTRHDLSSHELGGFRNSFPTDYALDKIAIEVTDYDELYLLIEDTGAVDGNVYHRDRAKIHRIICGNAMQDCDIPFAIGPEEYDLIKTDEYTVVGNRETNGSFYYIFSESECVYMPAGSGRDGSSPILYLEEGVLKYRTVNPKYVWVQTPLSMLDVVESEDDWKTEWGTVVVENGEVILTKTDEESVKEDYDIRKIFDEMKAGTSKEYTMPNELHWVTNFDRLMEYNKAKANLPEFDINSEECLMFRLLGMTVEEIEAEFGELIYRHSPTTGLHFYELNDLGIRLAFHTTSDFENGILKKDATSDWSDTTSAEVKVYGGISVGMVSSDYISKFGMNNVIYTEAPQFPGFYSVFDLDEYSINAVWDIPENIANEVKDDMQFGEYNEKRVAADKLIEYMRSGDSGITIKKITITKAS
ncbi:MAG: hypothetical protein IJ386_01995 [Clostridia bacterium]|nr:hypothetical protein [Clostridia bacterium]